MSQPASARQTIVRVVGAHGLPIAGATIEVRLKGKLAATIETSSGQSTVELDGDDTLELIASFGAVRTSLSINESDGDVTLTLPISRFVELASAPRARCPDGTTGSPCVTCIVEGREIRVCA